MSAQQQYSFPLLQDKEIAQCLNELGMQASLELLAKPTFEFVQPIYENLVTVLMGVTREELQQPVFAAIDALEFPELHDESIPAISFLRHLGRLMMASGIRDFSVKDLYKPEAPRLRRNLSAVINFAKYREEKLLAYTELQEHLEGLLQDKEGLAADNAALQEELQRLQEDRAAEMPEVARLEAETQELYSENQQLNKQQANLGNEVRNLKQQANALTDEASQLRYRLSQARSQQELLKSQIVQSPQKVQAMLEEMSNAVERERGLVADADRRSRDLHARLEVISKVEKEVQKAISLMEAVDVEINKKKEVSRKVKHLKAEIAANEHEVLQLVATQNHLKRQQGSLMERIERLEKQCSVKREAAESSLEQQLRDKEAIEAENAAAVAKVTQNEAMMRSLREKVQQLRDAHEAQIRAVLEQFNALRQQVADYHRRMEAAMKGGGEAAQVAVKPMKIR